ncbi:DUF2239 family protein [Corallococcus exiguus]|uniref:DUF2239 family protein n=1 Tax=Corallococcus exiguus TaxID=83462 RepID=A0A7X4Y985_9BACT|nr:DUF2239 family protein [Corallococcus exiguus]NBC41213.1 DUF2239 family protein [Corallococcus exiguus]TNV54059.1 DUF2239 family protein [Corallococcus exiguus]
MIPPSATWTAFTGQRLLASGSPAEVVTAAKAALDAGEHEALLLFDDATGRTVDFHLRGTLEEVLARLQPAPDPAAESSEPRGPGRPKLGVVAREVTLLPRHWEWLSEQPGGASVALRKLVEAARANSGDADRVRRAQAAADRFMTTMAGNAPGYEEAARALYAGDRTRFNKWTRSWPDDIRDCARKLAAPAFSKETP